MFTSNLRVRIPSSGLSTYPDVAVVCGRTARAADDGLAVVNPVVLAEATSDSTEEYDRGNKLRHYKQIPTLREVLIVSHRELHLTVHRREKADWIVVEARRERGSRSKGLRWILPSTTCIATSSKIPAPE